ncbi:MAG: hypothetical protein AAFZ18_20255 [Myxococcota bacterium]
MRTLIIGTAVAACAAACSSDKTPAATTTKSAAPASQPASAPAPAAPKVPDITLELGEMVAEKNGIKLSKLDKSPEFPKSRLFLRRPPFDSKIDANQTFTFEIVNYELGAQTTKDPFIANSGKGQHIHFIVDNGPYMAKYTPKFEAELGKGSHVVLAFLSRSHHESIKHGFTLTRLHVDEKTEEIQELSLDSAPHMFYSRPKGTYTGKDTKRVLLDFFLVGVKLSKEGNKVEATINGQKFMLTEWIPYVIEGLPMGEAKIKLRLVDKKGKTIPGPFNEVERTVTLAEG